VKKALVGAGVSHEIRIPSDADQTRRQAASLAPKRVVVAVLGGDGTINLAGTALVGGQAWLAPIPGGLENLFCREVGLPMHPSRAIRLLLEGHPQRWDVGFVGKRAFLQVAGFGLDGEVCAKATGLWKRILGRGAFVLSSLRLLARRPRLFTVSWEDQMIKAVHQVVISNGAHYGGRLKTNPKADPTDGYLDLAIFCWQGFGTRLVQLLSLWGPAGGGNAPGLKRVRVVEAHLSTSDTLPAEVDGEPYDSQNPRITIRHGALWVLKPGA